MGTVLASLLDLPEAQQRLGPYQLKKQLGRGGFAPVHLAVESYGGTELRWVAIKLFALDGLTEGEGSERSTQAQITRERIVEEARALCRVEHPNIVRFYTLVTDPSDCILGVVMEHLLGQSFDKILAERLKTRKQPMTIAEVLSLGGALASALIVVHRAGLVHRDVKPANVIDAAGTPKLIDFGVATAGRSATRKLETAQSALRRPLGAPRRASLFVERRHLITQHEPYEVPVQQPEPAASPGRGREKTTIMWLQHNAAMT